MTIIECESTGRCPICHRMIDLKGAEKHAKFHVNRLEVGQKTTVRLIVQIITGKEE